MYAIKCLNGSERLVATIPEDVVVVSSFEFNRNELPAPPDEFDYELVIDFDNHSFSLKKIEVEVPPEPEQPDSEQEVWDDMAQAYNEGFYEGVQQA